MNLQDYLREQEGRQRSALFGCITAILAGALFIAAAVAAYFYR